MVLNMKDPLNVEPIRLNNTVIEEGHSSKLLGVALDTHLTFSTRVENVVSSCRLKLK